MIAVVEQSLPAISQPYIVAIIVTAGAPRVPEQLLAQLKPGGCMVIPVAGRFNDQELVVLEKDAAGQVTRREVLPVMFVPLTGGSGTT